MRIKPLVKALLGGAIVLLAANASHAGEELSFWVRGVRRRVHRANGQGLERFAREQDCADRHP